MRSKIFDIELGKRLGLLCLEARIYLRRYRRISRASCGASCCKNLDNLRQFLSRNFFKYSLNHFKFLEQTHLEELL